MPVQQGATSPNGIRRTTGSTRFPGKHRIFFDTVSPKGAAEGITFASNYAAASKSGYGLEVKDLAIVICYRHWSTIFAFNDAVWAKYGEAWGKVINFNDPATNAPPVRNVWNATGLPGTSRTAVSPSTWRSGAGTTLRCATWPRAPLPAWQSSPAGRRPTRSTPS